MPEDQKTPATPSFPEQEERVLAFWRQAGTFQKSLDKEAPRGDYVFYDGPPFATGTPHYGHIVASIMKDVVPRYQTMRGYRVERKWGWDCHGLPIENIVEKELGISTKKEIEEIGVGKFNDLCRSKVLTYVDDWKQAVERWGRWADMDNAYKTMDLSFMESIWWAFKRLWEEGLIYQDYRSMHICPRCETTLSQSEVSEGYRDIKDLSATVKFRLKPGQAVAGARFVTDEQTYILAWTTTPWTLVGNVALAVGQEIRYQAVRLPGSAELFLVAGDLVGSVFKDQVPEVVYDNILGSELVGLEYEPLFDYYASDQALEKRAHGWRIYTADFVTTTDGTGVVHIAPAFGEDDMRLGREKDLPFVQHVATNGTFKPEVGDLAGRQVKPSGDHTATDVEIIKYLAAHNQLFSKEKYEHSYPHCWRCDTPLINYATTSWFVKVTAIKESLLKNAEAIAWSPDYIKQGRFGNWLEGARDWSISRQRFWASAIPIWECACGQREVIGSVKELEDKTGQKISDIHKDKVDGLSFPCPQCGQKMQRVTDVLDCWFESGSMPFAQLHYPFANKEKFENNFPAQFIGEGIDQTRAWFYYLHVIAGGIFQTSAYQAAMVNGIVLAEDGKKMSKRLNNYPDPAAVVSRYGADALRAYLAASPVMQAENLNFSEKGVQEALRKNIMVLWNVYKFYELFAAEKQEAAALSRNVLDHWILARLNSLIREVTAALAAYDLPRAMRPITEFIDELSTWYLRRSRERFKSEDEADKQAALQTISQVLVSLAKVMAPFTPFIAETLWQKLSGLDFQDDSRSVHLEAWPEPSRLADEEEVQAEMLVVRKIVELGLAQRDAAGLKIRQMLAEAKVSGRESLAAGYTQLIIDELNIQKLSFMPGGTGPLAVTLDTVLTPELQAEGLRREIVRTVNLLRKDAGFSLRDRTNLTVSGQAPELDFVMAQLLEAVKRDTLSDSLILVDEVAAPLRRALKTAGGEVVIGVERV